MGSTTHAMYLARLDGMAKQIGSIRLEFRAAIADAQNNLLQQINGTYVRDKLCGARCGELTEKIAALESRVEDLE